MAVEALVFRCQDRVDHARRDLIYRQLAAETLVDACFAERDAVAIEKLNALHQRAQKR